MKPWICPKCGRVWAGVVDQCRPCNNAIPAATNTYAPWVPPIKRATNEM